MDHLRTIFRGVMEGDEVKRLIQCSLPDADIELTDLTGTQDHYSARIVSQSFMGKSPVEQHQLVYRALGDAMRGPIHALALKTYTPEAWKKLNGDRS